MGHQYIAVTAGDRINPVGCEQIVFLHQQYKCVSCPGNVQLAVAAKAVQLFHGVRAVYMLPALILNQTLF